MLRWFSERSAICRGAGGILAVAIAAGLAYTAMGDEEPIPPGALPQRVGFDEHIRPLLSAHCVSCHGGVQQASDLSLIYRESAIAEAGSGERAIVPGDPEASELLRRVASDDPDLRMPPADHGPALSPHQIALLKQWIEQGAEWEELWSLVPPQRQPLPVVKRTDWVRTTIDPFVLARLEQEGLAPSPEGDRREWLRRVSFDLVGLPPSAEETAAFLADESPEAYQRVVDRLLASPHFGERWAAMWLDLARYADTVGYERDPPRDIWPYRDWLIRAINADLPYDEFVVKQLAGDLLPGATLEDRLATALHRNTQTNSEGGTDDEEFRVAAVIDRVSTTWQVFGGLTFGCAQCHSHPYDPIEHHEFYEFFALFDRTRDCDLTEDFPLLAVPERWEEVPRAQELDDQMRQLRAQLHAAALELASDRRTWTPLAPDKLSSTGSAELTTAIDPAEGVTEFLAGGTISEGSRFTIEAPLPPQGATLTAVRLEALPRDLEAALKTSELGFVISRLRAFLEIPGEGEPRELFFSDAVCDDPHPLLNPADSLKDGGYGWGAYPRIDRPRWSVFVLRDPVELPPGARLRLELKQDLSTVGSWALVIQRGRLAMSSDPRWTELVQSKEWKEGRQRLDDLAAQRQQIAATRIPVMEEQPAGLERHTHLFQRGNWLDKGERVEPGVPRVFQQPGSLTQVIDNRLALARWFASPEHPLTSRVMVNRVWEQLFGLGIVETVGDFGASGIAPSHPELLDDLAVRFSTDYGWSVKQLLRELVLSATYRQTSVASPEQQERDPRNVLLSRGPRQRLTAEMVRDQALVLSGRFSPKMYGPPVMPPQPDGIWRSVYSAHQWVTAEGEDRYRRAVYTYWKRTSPYPSMLTFDAPSREVCSVQRIATSTPLQALVTLNDPAYIECAQGLAERMASEGGTTPAAQIAWAYELATGLVPSDQGVAPLLELYTAATQAYDSSDDAMKSLGGTPESYALCVVASAVLNLDDVLTR